MKSKKTIPLYTLIAFGIIIAIVTAVAILLLEKTLPLPLVGEAAQKYQVGGYTGPLPTANTTTNTTKLFCDNVKNCGLVPPSGGSLKVVDADEKEVGFLIDFYLDRNTFVFDTNVRQSFQYNLHSAKQGVIVPEDGANPLSNSLQFIGLYYESTDCTGKKYGIVNYNSDFDFNIYRPFRDGERYYRVPDINSVFPRETKLFHSRFDTNSNTCVVGDVRNTQTAAIVEEIQLPTYRGPLKIVVG